MRCFRCNAESRGRLCSSCYHNCGRCGAHALYHTKTNSFCVQCWQAYYALFPIHNARVLATKLGFRWAACSTCEWHAGSPRSTFKELLVECAIHNGVIYS